MNDHQSEMTKVPPELHGVIDALCTELEGVIYESGADATVALSATCLLLSKLLTQIMGNKYSALESFMDVGVQVIQRHITGPAEHLH